LAVTDNPKISVEFTIREAEALCRIIQNHNPPKSDELIVILLYARIKRAIEERAE
jgi:hypothetical protein